MVVANPRKTRTISQNEPKSDERDAVVLACLGRADRNLLGPIIHGSEEAQHDLLQIKLRDSLVRARVAVINSVRFTLKSLGYRVSNPSNERFHKSVLCEVPEPSGVLLSGWLRLPNLCAYQESGRFRGVTQQLSLIVVDGNRG